jgi:low affinity Fe/Cu permease
MKTLEKIKEYSWAITLFLLLVVFLKQCGVNREVDRIDKEIKKITQSTDSIQESLITKDQMDNALKQNMFNFLIYEDDFDKGKTSLSDIKSKIENPNK